MTETSKYKFCIPNVSNFTPIYIADNTVNICYKIILYENTCSSPNTLYIDVQEIFKINK